MPEEPEKGRLPTVLRTAFNHKAEREQALVAIEADTEPATQERERAKFKAEVPMLRKWSLVGFRATSWSRATPTECRSRKRLSAEGKGRMTSMANLAPATQEVFGTGPCVKTGRP
jgi:hypothetical protein